MPRKRTNKQGAGANENWVKQETMDSYKRKALKLVAERNEFESTRKFEAVRVDARTVKYIEIKN